LNFFLADVRGGLGPYLAVYLLVERSWDEASIGVVMSIATIAGIVTQTPAGALVDAIRAKRALIAIAALAVTAVSLALPWLSVFWGVAASQGLAHTAGAMFEPAIAAVALGAVGRHAFNKRNCGCDGRSVGLPVGADRRVLSARCHGACKPHQCGRALGLHHQTVQRCVERAVVEAIRHMRVSHTAGQRRPQRRRGPGDQIGLRDVRTVRSALTSSASRQCFNLWSLGDFCNREPWKSRVPIAHAQRLCVADDRFAGGTTAQQLPDRLSSNTEIAPQTFLIAHLRSMQFKTIGQRLQIAGPNEFWRGID
jgi:hypothetical protein